MRVHIAAHKIILTIGLVAWLPSVTFAMTPGQVYEAVKDSVVVVRVGDQQGRQVRFGSGVMLPSGDIITNYHVVKAAAMYTVGRGKKFHLATLKAVDPDKDLCLLSAPGLVAEPARLGKAAGLKVGDPVYAVGAPQGLELSLSEGIISQLRGGAPPIIQTTVAISPGSSGGGLFNAEGELVGITTFGLKDGQSLNFALPVEWIGSFGKGKTGLFPVTKRLEQKQKILYSSPASVHLGDEEFPDWPPLYGTCFEFEFGIASPGQSLTLILQTYGLEITAPIYLNNHKVAVLPPQSSTRRGTVRPNEWSKDRFIDIPTDKLKADINKLTICTDIVVRPQFLGDKDDFKIKNLRLICE